MNFPLEGCSGSDPLQGGYGWLDKADNGATFHPGLDLNAGNGGDADLGRLITASAPGVVRYVQNWDGVTFGYGTHLWVEHDDGNWVHHAHCQTLLCSPDQRVAQGTLLSRCGKSGFQTWAHDHFEVTYTKPGSWSQWPRGWTKAQVEAVYRNPAEWLEKLEEDVAQIAELEGVIAELNRQVADLKTEVGGLNGITTTLQAQLDAVRSQLADANSTIGALENDVIPALRAGQGTDPSQVQESLARLRKITEIVNAPTGT